ncbi:alpha-galactosidase [Pseudonocardia hierapolitana]|uniref:alpha-galactosidase n=1 Tax=Pseudonocardia hierapolitana TaxID=1128676 RepID=A0A561SHZ4_9PSEU|nr:alpha-galactosidase [Pseudonocardia hierapolitana]TWF74510.1 alpha-galactosidase [Pseudonocardia hierapolitana]
MTEWELRTARSAYVVRASEFGLELAHWGRPVRVVPPRGTFETPADIAPLEFAAAGVRHAQAAELLVEGGASPRLVPGSVAHTDGRLQAMLRDDETGLEVDLHVRTSRRHDVVERWAVLRATRPLVLHRAFGAGWNVPVGPGARVGTLVGAWSRECTPAEVDLPAGRLSLGSRQGITSHTYAPVVTLRSRDADDAYGIALAWSGSWRLAVDAVPFREVVRVSGGIDDETVIRLGPGEEFETPHLLGVWSPDGPAGVARAWHTYQRGLARGPEHRPVVYNSWYATTFDVRVEHQLALADVAAELGVEVFVVDDGWFRGRTSDRAGLGDWFVDEEKFPDGLEALTKGVLDRGMRFGLWVEPEAVNPDSDLYRAHPDWVHQPLLTLRNQYVLDLGRPEVEAWAAAMLRRLLTEHPVSYLKWDMNRAITLGGSLRHTQAYYRLMRMLRAEFPHVTVEACAGGGGRVDNAVLALSDVVWPSDETGPRDRLAIQHGFLSAYPPHVMSSWVTDEPDRLDTAPSSLEFRFVVAMAGVLGIGADLLAWSPDVRGRARGLVALYREIRPVVHAGEVTWHGAPGDPACAVQYTTADRIVLLAWARPGAGSLRVPLAPTGRVARSGTASPAFRHGESGVAGSRYRVRGSGEFVDAEVEIPFRLAPDCDVVVLDRVGE